MFSFSVGCYLPACGTWPSLSTATSSPPTSPTRASCLAPPTSRDSPPASSSPSRHSTPSATVAGTKLWSILHRIYKLAKRKNYISVLSSLISTFFDQHDRSVLQCNLTPSCSCTTSALSNRSFSASCHFEKVCRSCAKCAFMILSRKFLFCIRPKMAVHCKSETFISIIYNPYSGLGIFKVM